MPIPTAWRSAEHHIPCRGRRFSGIPIGHAIPAALAHEQGIPAGFVGLSAFGAPKIIKTILRSGLLTPDGVLLCADLDQVAGHHRVQANRIRAGPDSFPHAWEYSRDPGAKRKKLQAAVGVDENLAKVFFIMAIYGASLARWEREVGRPIISIMPNWFIRYHKEQASIRKKGSSDACRRDGEVAGSCAAS